LRANAVKCPECGKNLVKVVGEGFNVQDYEHYRFTVGRVCRKCKIIFLNPIFSEYKQQFSHIGEEHEKKKD